MKTENSKNYIITGNSSILYFLIKYKIYLSNDRYKYKKSLLPNYYYQSLFNNFIDPKKTKIHKSRNTQTPLLSSNYCSKKISKKYRTKKNLDTTVDIVQRTLQIIRIKKKGNQHNYVPFPSKKKSTTTKNPSTPLKHNPRILLSSQITSGNREQGRLDLDSYSGSRVLPRKVVERNLTLIVGGGGGAPLAAFTSAKVFEVNAGFPGPFPSLLRLGDRSQRHRANVAIVRHYIDRGERGDLPRACHPCLPPTYVMLFTSQALLSARFTIFYVTWMDSQFFRIVPTPAIRSRRSRGNTKCV